MNYQQQAQQWQALFRQKQQGSFLSRVLLWLVAGIMLVFAMGVLLFVLMLSWLLIPVFLYKRHQLRKQGKSFSNRLSNSNSVHRKALVG